jgi:hypothetical protein
MTCESRGTFARLPDPEAMGHLLREALATWFGGDTAVVRFVILDRRDNPATRVPTMVVGYRFDVVDTRADASRAVVVPMCRAREAA